MSGNTDTLGLYKQLLDERNKTINRNVERLGGDVIQVVANLFTGQEVKLGSKNTLQALTSYLDYLKYKNQPVLDGNGKAGNNDATGNNGEIAAPRVNNTI